MFSLISLMFFIHTCVCIDYFKNDERAWQPIDWTNLPKEIVDETQLDRLRQLMTTFEQKHFQSGQEMHGKEALEYYNADMSAHNNRFKYEKSTMSHLEHTKKEYDDTIKYPWNAEDFQQQII